MIYAVMDGNRNILEDFETIDDAREWCNSYKFLTGQTSFVLARRSHDVFYELLGVV